ncbi:MAG: hypothetical protein M3R00_06955, partial [Pseudomonadota bacterium]|nr:hypothetical protein [Pseudomonadota bacterium]
MANQNDKLFYHPKTLGLALYRLIGVLVAFVYWPLTMPFLHAASAMQQLETTNAELWNTHRPNQNWPSSFNYVFAAIRVTGNSIWLFAKLLVNVPFLFLKSLVGSIYFGFSRLGYGPFYALTIPSWSVNQYDPTTGQCNSELRFRSRHLLSLALVLTILISATVTALVFFYPTLLAPLALFTKLTGLSLTKLFGIKATGYVLPLFNFLSVTLLTLPAIFAFECCVFAVTYLGRGIGDFARTTIECITYPAYPRYVVGTILSFINVCIALVIAPPIYIVFKPIYQLFDSVRTIYQSNKHLWKSGTTYAQKLNTHTKEWLYKTGIAFSIIGNTIARVLFVPLQVVMSALYAPLQSIRHASKYGLLHV